MQVCPNCRKAELKDITLTRSLSDPEGSPAVVIIRDVPAEECSVCGQSFYELPIEYRLQELASKHLEETPKAQRSSRTIISIPYHLRLRRR